MDGSGDKVGNKVMGRAKKKGQGNQIFWGSKWGKESACQTGDAEVQQFSDALFQTF